MLSALSVILVFILSFLFLGSPRSLDITHKNVSVVIPAFNEEKSIKHVIDTVKRVEQITEIIVVDDGSTDNTYKIVSEEKGVLLLKHEKNKGKGAAIKTGLKKVTNEIVLFLDADLSEINEAQVEAIIQPILDGNADITKTKFKREAGRVTELTAKPLLNFFFPELSFEQPLSGQFAAVKRFLDKIDLEHDYGVDIGIVLDADAQGLRIQEVDIGNIVHEMSSLEELNLMANEVVRTIVDRAITYGRFTLVDDLGSAIRMELLGLSILTFGVMGLFFIKFMSSIITLLVLAVGLGISIFYLYKIIKMSIKMYRQTKVPTKQLFASFLRMHFPVVISVILLLVLLVSLLGSVSISSTEISIEPVSKNIVISTTNSSSNNGLDIRGPYTIENAFENEEHLIRLPTSALNTLQAQYGDQMYINGTEYQLEQSVESESGLIRIPKEARSVLEIQSGQVIRDSDLRDLFDQQYIVNNYNVSLESQGNDTVRNVSDGTSVNLGLQYVTQKEPAKIVEVYVNGTLMSKSMGVLNNNSTYNLYINDNLYDSIPLNSTSNGTVYDEMYDTSEINIVVLGSDSNSTSIFADNNSLVRFMNINLP